MSTIEQVEGADSVERRIIGWEVAAIGALFFVPELWRGVSLFYRLDRISAQPEWVLALGAVLIALERLVPAVFIVWTSGEPLGRFGIRRFRLWPGIAFCLGAFGLSVAARLIASSVVAAPAPTFEDLMWPYRDHSFAAGMILLSLAVRYTTVEFVFRGYLFTRLQEIGGNDLMPVVVTSLAFAIVHLGQGVLAVPLYFVVGMFLALSFSVTKSIWPGVIATFAVNSAFYLLRFLSR